ncbi:Colicin immunity protein / pyocin immunity protein [Citrobacter freundii]|nr:Colicin immunity protein / pyocin immunity protein [Citrobacter freundii]
MNHLKQKLEDYTESEFLDFLNEFSANPRYQGEMDRESLHRLISRSFR